MTRSKIFACIVSVVTFLIYASVILSMFLDKLPFDTMPKDLSRLMFYIGLNSVLPFLALVIFYLIYTVFGNVVPKEKRWLWFWLICFGHFLVIPFFWHCYIWDTNIFSKQHNAAA